MGYVNGFGGTPSGFYYGTMRSGMSWILAKQPLRKNINGLTFGTLGEGKQSEVKIIKEEWNTRSAAPVIIPNLLIRNGKDEILLVSHE